MTAPAAPTRLMTSLRAGRVLLRSGLVRPVSPVRLARTGLALRGWGLGVAGGFEALAARNPDGEGIVDEIGTLTFSQVNERGDRLADSLAGLGVRAGDGVAVLCRNHRGLVDASLAAAKLGADVCYLNTAFAGPQLAEVLERETPRLVIYDAEFEEILPCVKQVQRVVAWRDAGADAGGLVLEELVEAGNPRRRTPPGRPSRLVVLTSGTTGAPKGAPRSEARVGDAVALLSALPVRRDWRVHIAAPLFHTWGLAHLLLSLVMETTSVLTRRFDPEDCLRITAEQRCDELVVVPVMLQRMLQLPEEVLARYDLSQVSMVASSGSALPGDLATAWMDRFGDTLYNTYGSTEVAYATIASPQDLRAAPGTAGRPPLGTTVRLYDDHGRPTPPGLPGRIFVGNGLLFEGYSGGGGGKEVIDGLMASGDVGRFDAEGRLFVEGRDDDMVVSGGENVFPQEVEDCLARHPAVLEAAVVGVEDADFGSRLRAFVVPTEPGAAHADELRAWVRSSLAGFKVPREVVFLDELPRNATGKVRKTELDRT